LIWAWRRTTGALQRATLVLAVCSLAPVLHLVPMPIAGIAADRYLYLPLAALAIFAAGSTGRLSSRATRTAGIVLLILVALSGVRTLFRSLDWSDEIRFWAVETASAPRLNPSAETAYGDALFAADRPGDAELRFTEALARMDGLRAREILRHEAFRSGIEGKIALCRSGVGDYDAAIDGLTRLVELEPANARHRFNLGIVLARDIQFERARSVFQSLAADDPNDPRTAAALE
jgi:tetratricopeptide (TPR) repeat protein